MTKTIRVPGQIRRHVIKNLDPKTKGERDLKEASLAGARQLEANEMNSLNTIELHLTNEAVGVALDIARGWLDDDNGNNVMAGKSMLKFELEYEPDDPRELRHAIKMPKSVASWFSGKYGYDPKRWLQESDVVRFDMDCMSWQANGASGRVRAETLNFFLREMHGLKENPHPATARAAKKFLDTYTEPYEQTQRLITGYLAMDEDQAPDFTEAIHGDDEPKKPKRLVVIACGGKKSEKPGKIPADERYTGNYFTACLMAAEVMDGPTMVLSALHGLIPLSKEIGPYDITFGDPRAVREDMLKQQAEELGLLDAKVTILGGAKYVKAVRQIWPDAEAPLKGGIGQQLKQLAGMYEGEALEDDERQDQEPEGERPERTYQTKVQEVGYLPHRNQPKPRVLWFGGKAGKSNPKPGRWVKAEVIYTGEGKLAINRLGTDEELMTCTLRTLIHWGPLEDPSPERKPEFVKEFEKWDEEPEAVEEVVPQGGYEVPENWLELAEEGDTEAARRYWKRRCDEYRRTGK
jgi:hypothetical protein